MWTIVTAMAVDEKVVQGLIGLLVDRYGFGFTLAREGYHVVVRCHDHGMTNETATLCSSFAVGYLTGKMVWWS